jgi:small subunit ribosomal protein S18
MEQPEGQQQAPQSQQEEAPRPPMRRPMREGPPPGGGGGGRRDDDDYRGMGGPGGMRDRSRRFKRKRKMCAFCLDKSGIVDYKDVPRLRRFITERGKIIPRRQSGTCSKHQRVLASAIRKARECALLPYVVQ